MPTYQCPACNTEQGATVRNGDTGRHHCPNCGAAIADSQRDLDWS